jgi:hypothetical protein
MSTPAAGFCLNSALHFARQFKVATGLLPHKYVILRRVERASLFLQAPGQRHAGAVPQVRKNRLKGRKSLQEPGPRALYHSVRIGARVARASPVTLTGRTDRTPTAAYFVICFARSR